MGVAGIPFPFLFFTNSWLFLGLVWKLVKLLINMACVLLLFAHV